MTRYALPVGAILLALGAMAGSTSAQTPAAPAARAPQQQQVQQQQSTTNEACQHLQLDPTSEPCTNHSRTNAQHATQHSSVDDWMMPHHPSRQSAGSHHTA